MEESAFQNKRIAKRRLMEEGGAELRRIHVIYFLSRKGCVEHPHLIRIHHHSKNGVRLRDIKRWMGELRGKKMPELFAWSYKRIYKIGYVWQDLVDDDLVTPISDNEYVLKGSEISSTTNNIESAKEGQEASDQTHSSDGSAHVNLSKSSSDVEDSSTTSGSESSALTDVSPISEQENNSDTVNQESSDKPQSKKCYSSGIFQNLITCGGVDTSDSLVIPNKRSKPLSNMCSSCSSVGVKNSTKEDRFSVPCASHKPLYKPNCSQCRKRFKPEKLCAHMKYCKGMKAKGKDRDISVMSTSTRNGDSVSGYLQAR